VFYFRHFAVRGPLPPDLPRNTESLFEEEAAYLLQQEMEAQEPSDAEARTTQLYLV